MTRSPNLVESLSQAAMDSSYVVQAESPVIKQMGSPLKI